MTVANPNLTPELSSPQAEALTTQICEAVTDVHALILRAQDGRADRALGYESWQAYVDERFPVTIRQVAREMRPQIVAEMRAEGRSLRAIASTLGVGKSQVERDLATVPDGTVPDRVKGLDGKSRPATRPPIEPEEEAAIVQTVEEEHGPDPSPEVMDRAYADNAESKRVPVALSKPDVGGGVSHPARFSDPLLPIFASLLTEGMKVLDPFAGTGKIHDLRVLIDVTTVGVEIEPEWAALHPDTLEGNALDLQFDDAAFDAIVTSPTYGNRLADHHNAADPESRRSYTHDLGRALSEDNSGDLQWGDEYRDFHQAAWREAIRVVKPEGRFVLNIKDHIRGGEWQDVAGWHVATLCELGLVVVAVRPVVTSSLRQGENAALRVGAELVIAFDKP